MFQLWKLVLLCGLLAGTSASLLDIRGNDVLRKLKSGLERGLDTFDSTLESESTIVMVNGTWELPAKYCACITRGYIAGALFMGCLLREVTNCLLFF